MSAQIVSIDLGLRSYDIYIGQGLIYRFMDFVPDDVAGRHVFIVLDDHMRAVAETVQGQILQAGALKCETLVMAAGEKAKSFAEVERILNWMLGHGLSRNSLLVAIGGGVVGDVVGFCASIALRGIPYIQVPTTLLAQVDSSVGGKTGINMPEGKNLVGSFYQPTAVIVDTNTLQTLPPRQILAGYAEVVKYGLINNAPFFQWLEENGRSVCALEPDAIAHAVQESIKTKAQIVETDEREAAQRALLNFGHTFGHALETVCNFDQRLLHGEAIAIGMMMAFDLSVRMGACAPEALVRVEKHLQDIGLPTSASFVEPPIKSDPDHIIDIMRRDKKAMPGRMVFVLAGGIGQAYVSAEVPEDTVRAVLKDSLGSSTTGNKGRWKSAFSSHS